MVSVVNWPTTQSVTVGAQLVTVPVVVAYTVEVVRAGEVAAGVVWVCSTGQTVVYKLIVSVVV